MQKCIEGTISGRNLDHEYLFWIKDIADQFNLKGITYFKNDGSIKVIAEGDEGNLILFLKKLNRGRSFFSLFSPVENFSVVWKEPSNEFEGFSVSESQ